MHPCAWVGQEDERTEGTGGPAGPTTRERCTLVGIEPTIGCDNAVLLLDQACNYTLIFRSMPAFAACPRPVLLERRSTRRASRQHRSGCNECRWGVCELPDVDDSPSKDAILASKVIEIICMIGVALTILSCLMRSAFLSLHPPEAGEKPDDSAVDRAGLAAEIDREQRFTIRGARRRGNSSTRVEVASSLQASTSSGIGSRPKMT